MADASAKLAQSLKHWLAGAVVNPDFSEAVLTLYDGSQLCFCHRVGERWVKAVGPKGREAEAGSAGELCAAVTMFRLNAKHLEIQFDDGSRWDERLTP